MVVYPLSEGQFTVDQTKVFVPFDASKEQLAGRPAGSLLVEIQPFVVKTASDLIVLDAGLGYEIEGELQIHRQLKARGIQPEQVTKLILSHLHKDHMGGIAYRTSDVIGQESVWDASFPNATYYVQRAELAYASATSSSSYLPSLLEWLSRYERVVLLDGATTIDNIICCEPTGGHCPFHQAIWIREEGQTVFYGGDEAPQLQQMRHRFVAKYDKDGKKAMQLRAQWWETAAVEHWQFLFYHDVANAVYQR
ncbi:MAG: MBL fold metallo-hydrolase [Sphingomonadales bacterium]|nr:MBL fold metallo-hydrolase [Sphingomonadales bacterium]